MLHFHVKTDAPIFRREKDMLTGHRPTMPWCLQGLGSLPMSRRFLRTRGVHSVDHGCLHWDWLKDVIQSAGPKLQHHLSWTSRIRLPCDDFPVSSLIPSKPCSVSCSLKVPLVILAHNVETHGNENSGFINRQPRAHG